VTKEPMCRGPCPATGGRHPSSGSWSLMTMPGSGGRSAA
jgi:hypothetical protein